MRTQTLNFFIPAKKKRKKQDSEGTAKKKDEILNDGSMMAPTLHHTPEKKEKEGQILKFFLPRTTKELDLILQLSTRLISRTDMPGWTRSLPVDRGDKPILHSCLPVQSHSTVTISEDGENPHQFRNAKGDRYARVDKISTRSLPADRGDKSILHSCLPVQSHSTVTISEDGETTHLFRNAKGDRYTKVDQFFSVRGEDKSIPHHCHPSHRMTIQGYGEVGRRKGERDYV
eukprot:GFUD01063033.1.p1 GENE.GFUD01063033.1~~GFUD01063033.1.p1  ORF type:complete len:230 (-),score=57.73 GFUD01063033.1:34-723(-)